MRNRTETPQSPPQHIGAAAAEPAKNTGSSFHKFESEAVIAKEDLQNVIGGRGHFARFFNLTSTCGSLAPQ